MGDFEAGHIRAAAKGGSNTVSNVLPVCSMCNRSMATMQMDQFVERYFPENLQSFKLRNYKWLLPDDFPLICHAPVIK